MKKNEKIEIKRRKKSEEHAKRGENKRNQNS